MSPDLKECEAQAMKLDPQARAALAEHLIRSLDTMDDAENERLWLEEYQTMINASEQVFSMLDAEESQEKKWDHPQ
jgi:hypothetical protein